MFRLMFAALLLLAAPSAAQAQAKCAPRADVLKALTEKLGEARVAVGITDDLSLIIETYTNPDTGAWTIVGTTVDGMSCVLAYGGGYRAVAPIVGDPA